MDDIFSISTNTPVSSGIGLLQVLMLVQKSNCRADGTWANFSDGRSDPARPEWGTTNRTAGGSGGWAGAAYKGLSGAESCE